MIFWLFCVAVAVQCGYALWFAVAQRALRPAQGDRVSDGVPPGGQGMTGAQPVSVIICAKNEAGNLRKNLPMVLEQRYGADYGVVVVDDASTDDTLQVLAELGRKYGHLRVVKVAPDEERILKGKKHALKRGVEAAKYDWLLLTDADCVPGGTAWLKHMTEPLGERRAGSGERGGESDETERRNGGNEIVLGYGGYNERPGLLNAFIRWETMHTWLQYSSYARAGVPYMAVGRNMACTKSVLLAAQQDERWNVLPSGDDDMLVQIMGTKENVAVVPPGPHGEAATYSDAKATWGEWARQKQRHLSTGKYYSVGTRLLLTTYAVTQAQVWGAGALMCMAHWGIPTLGLGHEVGNYWPWVLPLLAARCIPYWCLWAATAVRLRQKSLVLWLPIMDIGWVLYNFAFLPWITWKNKRQWT